MGGYIEVLNFNNNQIETLPATICELSSSASIYLNANNICNETIYSCFENNNKWHHSLLSKSQYDLALKELEKEKKAAVKENKEAKDSLEKLKRLKVSHHKLEKDRASVRLKVQDALQKIEKMDFS